MNHKTRITGNPIPDALRNFASLPDDAYVRAPVVAGLFACSIATVWRKSASGSIPRPRKFSSQLTAWNVGELRLTLRK